ncbi:hypothetical protein HETIRDRAFT_174130 [Heterobasidion irregulare TC 32-1]|uniref:Uncharacterized protein n=1 Tax=Heterobasidion irregulare (strain TC 32-1) TaxID=747525 RepID=W4JUJ7_HETIT|nr:uncharacterized protein HETIRDRAFT_174130 [Heterobasidion irregulare TC 32-1]ETW77228.1 hypothetical protein HETIRDRAFT_174130 [Heterobasidion irregulare TC 32-1]
MLDPCRRDDLHRLSDCTWRVQESMPCITRDPRSSASNPDPSHTIRPDTRINNDHRGGKGMWLREIELKSGKSLGGPR